MRFQNYVTLIIISFTSIKYIDSYIFKPENSAEINTTRMKIFDFRKR